MDYYDEIDTSTVSRLSFASRNGLLSEVQRLLDSGSSPIANDNRGWTCLHEAAAAGQIDCIQELLADDRIDVNVKTFEGQTPLILASEKGQFEVVAHLLEAGANVDAAPPSGRSALIAAVEANKVEVVKHLLTHGSYVNQAYFSGWTPLHFACHNGSLAMTKLLLASLALVNAADKDGLTPLFLAAQKGSVEVIQALLDVAKAEGLLEAVVNAVATDGSQVTPIYLSAQEGHLDCLKLLVNNGAVIDVEKSNSHSSNSINHGKSVKNILPIHSAIEKGKEECVLFLAKHMKQESFLKPIPSPFHFCIMWNKLACLEGLISATGPLVTSPRLLLPDLVDAEDSLISSQISQLFPDLSSSVCLGYTHLDPLAFSVFFENIEMTRMLLECGLNPNPANTKAFPPLLLAINFAAKERYPEVNHHNPSYSNGHTGYDMVELLLSFGANPTIYHPKVKGNLCLLSCLQHEALMITLISYGADVDSLFHPRPVPHFLYKFLKDDEVLEGREDGTTLSLTYLFKLPFIPPLPTGILMRHIVFKLFKFLLPLVFPLPMSEYVKYKRFMNDADWTCLQSWSRWTPSLKQLCRRRIRLEMTGHNWINQNGEQFQGTNEYCVDLDKFDVDLPTKSAFSYQNKLASINLPCQLFEYLTYKDEMFEFAPRKTRPIFEPINESSHNLDLDAMD